LVTCYRRRNGPAAHFSSSQANQSLKELVVVEGLHFSAVELDQGLLKLGSLGCGGIGAIGELGATCFSLNSSASKLRSFSSSNAISLSSCFVRFSDSSARILDSAILLSTSGSRRQLSIDKNNRQRGNDAPDAPLLVEGEPVGAEGDVVIGGIQSNQANHQATQELNPGGTVESEETELSMQQVWRNRSNLAGQRR
jgi:hypothetical protein